MKAIREARRFALIVCGRRWGKSELAARFAEIAAAAGRQRVWIIGETYEVADITLDACYSTFARFEGGVLLDRYSRAEHRIDLVTGGSISAKSADHPDGLLGRGLHKAIFEEAAATRARIFYQYVRPALSDYHGGAMFITTPRGRGNWIYDLKCDHEDDPDWSFLTSPSWANTHVYPGGEQDPEIVTERLRYERAGMAPLWGQEYAASFAHLQGRVWQAWNPARHVAPRARIIEGVQEWRLVIDWGFRNPCCGLVVGRTGDGNYRFVDEWYETGRTLDEVAEACRVLRSRWNCTKGWADPSEPGNIEALNRAGFHLSPAYNDVTAGILAVAQALGREGGVLVADEACPNLKRQMENYAWREASKGAPEDPVKDDDHAADCARYGVASWERLDGTGVRPFQLKTEPLKSAADVARERWRAAKVYRPAQ